MTTVLGRLTHRLLLKRTVLTSVDTTTAPLVLAGVAKEIIRGVRASRQSFTVLVAPTWTLVSVSPRKGNNLISTAILLHRLRNHLDSSRKADSSSRYCRHGLLIGTSLSNLP